MLGSPSALTSQSRELLPGLQFSATMVLAGRAQSSGLMVARTVASPNPRAASTSPATQVMVRGYVLHLLL